jgi:hypothetical protein
MPPKDLLEPNALDDYIKFNALVNLDVGEDNERSNNRLIEAKKRRLEALFLIGSETPLPVRFSVKLELRKLDISDFLSTPYYMGFLAVARQSSAKTCLTLPNSKKT